MRKNDLNALRTFFLEDGEKMSVFKKNRIRVDGA